jgi:dolichyl-phosphate beta-glucosyltransferase
MNRDGTERPDRIGADASRRLPIVVIPCYNEARRLDHERLRELVRSQRLGLLFVNDGSTDETGRILAQFARSASTVEVLTLPRNAGKAEAVRLGLAQALESGAPIVGYYDADLATPPNELLRLLDVLETKPNRSVVTAARVALLGRKIVRRRRRHYLGRVFATLAAVVLRLPVYDTQCGAKLFRVTPAFAAATTRPFRSSWIFDVELIGRLLRGTDGAQPVPPSAFEEVPLWEWQDVSGSKIGVFAMARALFDLAVLEVQFNRRSRVSVP